MTSTLRAPIELTHPGDNAPYAAVRSIIDVMIENHACVVLPSDTTYGICAFATDRDAVRLARTLSGSVDPLPVTVGSITDAARLLELTRMHEGFLGQLWPGAFTGVANVRRPGRLVARNVNPSGSTLGVRVTSDHIESRLSIETDGEPIVSTAVRYGDGRPVRNGAHAFQLVSEAMTRHVISERRVLFMKKDKFRYSTHSTVGRMTTTDDLIEVLREGVYSAWDVHFIVRQVKTPRALAPNVIAPRHSTAKMRSWSDPEALKDVL